MGSRDATSQSGGAAADLEVVHGDGERVEQVGVDGVVLEVDEGQLLTNGLQGSLGAQGRHVSTYVTVGLLAYLGEPAHTHG